MRGSACSAEAFSQLEATSLASLIAAPLGSPFMGVVTGGGGGRWATTGRADRGRRFAGVAPAGEAPAVVCDDPSAALAAVCGGGVGPPGAAQLATAASPTTSVEVHVKSRDKRMMFKPSGR